MDQFVRTFILAIFLWHGANLLSIDFRQIYYFGGKTNPKFLAAKNIEAFLSPLVTERQMAASM
jgi:hypothetical protein